VSAWLLIDDNQEEAETFAEQISAGSLIVVPLAAKEAQSQLTAGELKPAGVLMDVDLSNDAEALTTGPGLAQNCRVSMQQRAIPSFPIVRFSWRERVAANIGHDTSSDDLFDMKIEKDGLSDNGMMDILRQKLTGLQNVYRCSENQTLTLDLLAIDRDAWEAWGHPNFEARLAQADRTYLRAGMIIRLLLYPGLLIGEELLSFRLGIEPTASSDWRRILEALEPARYRGAGSDAFPRWWARGVSSWWPELAPEAPPLAGTNISERIEVLSQRFPGIVALDMPLVSRGERPWRYCTLTFEREGRLIPVDPNEAVRMQPRSEMPVWLDPLYAALGPAMRASKEDQRLNQADLERLTVAARRISK
jgi:hypothetical protein